MEQKKFGYLLLGIAVLMLAIVYIFHQGLETVINSSCTIAGHDSCPMTATLNQQTFLSIIIVSFVVLIALYLIFSKPQKEVVIKTKTVTKKAPSKKYNISELRPDEKKAFSKIKKEKTIFQAALIEELGLGKAKMTRILDKLEGKGFVERKRRGMTNVVVLKE